MMMGDYRGALKDSRDAVQIDDNFAKGYDRIIKCSLSMGDVVGAELAIKKLSEIGSNNDICNKYEEQCKQLRSLGEKVVQCYDKKDFRTAGEFPSTRPPNSAKCLVDIYLFFFGFVLYFSLSR